jgi:DNA invertase Pin-like site-specific DNA recombinase
MTSSRLPQGGGRARRSPSLHTSARERYLTAAKAAGLDAAAAPACADAAADTPLTERVRALYEGSVVPVREIARLVGVGERRIYRYACKLGWKARVRWLKPAARGRACLPVERVRALYEDSSLPVREIARLAGVSDVTVYNYARKLAWKRGARPLVKGAGGRFIPLAEAGRPHVRGLKALDPQGAEFAAERCARAGVIADQAAAAAAADARARAAREQAARDAQVQTRTFERLADALVDLTKFRVALSDGCSGGTAERADRLAARLERAILAQVERLVAPVSAPASPVGEDRGQPA